MRVYLDYAASTPVDKEVFQVMQPYFSQEFGNPGSVHSFGQKAQAAIDKARKTIADAFGIDFDNVIFTGSATEANNLIIRGIIKPVSNFAFRLESEKAQRDKQSQTSKLPHIIISKIEHDSVLKTCQDLEKSGQAEVTYIEVDSGGFVNISQIQKSLRKETVLVSIMYVNNEIGTIQPIQKIAQIIREFRLSKLQFQNQSKFTVHDLSYPLFHTDAVQAVNYAEPIRLDKIGVDFMTISGHKIYGPKGIGALLINLPSAAYHLQPIITGGEQEFGMRSGTENVPEIVGFSKAVEISLGMKQKEAERLKFLRAQLQSGIQKAYPRATFHGVAPLVSNILNVSFVGYDSEELLYRFDKFGIAVSGGSACHAKALIPSRVLMAMNLPENEIRSAVRFSLGRYITEKDIAFVCQKLPEILGK